MQVESGDGDVDAGNERRRGNRAQSGVRDGERGKDGYVDVDIQWRIESYLFKVSFIFAEVIYAIIKSWLAASIFVIYQLGKS